jgi:type II secretory ATPase GspE/PulE/Tfp pilus assembly ATPase PilB-like protein
MRNGKGGQMLREIAQQTISHVYNKLIDEGSNTTSSFNPKAYFSSTVTYDLGPRQRLLLRCQNNPVVDGFDFIARFRLDDEAPAYTCQSMGYTPSQIELIEDAMRGRRGLIIVAGIPGSGKTTLVQTILTYFPDRDRLKFVTLDDPVEFKVPGVSHATIKTVAGDAQESAKMYMQAMESWLRGNPDVISMGEIRNFASGFSALTAAEVGCLGLATLHANSQIGIYGRLVDPAIGLSMHSITAPGIIALCIYQKLVPLLCQHCKLELAAMPAALQQQMRRVEQRFGVDIGAMRFAGGRIDGEPCPNCKGRGTRGQKVVAEVYHPTRDFLRALRSGDEFAAQDVWRSENDGRFDTDDMNGKPVFLHAFKNALDGLIDPRVCEEFGSFEKFRLPSEWIPAHQVMRS